MRRDDHGLDEIAAPVPTVERQHSVGPLSSAMNERPIYLTTTGGHTLLAFYHQPISPAGPAVALAAERRVGGVWRRRERSAAVGPTATLDAVDRHRDLGARREQGAEAHRR